MLQADAAGTLEAVKAAMNALPQDIVQLRFLLSAANDITESDIDLASASGGMIIGFNVVPSETVQAAAKRLGEAAACIHDTRFTSAYGISRTQPPMLSCIS